MTILLGLAGPMQAGKQENRSVFEQRALVFIDVNALLEPARISDPRLVGLYQTLGLTGCVNEHGRRNAKYYLTVMRRPELHSQVQRTESMIAWQLVQEQLNLYRDRNVVVSWGYLHEMAPYLIGMRHVILLTCDHDLWYARLRARGEILGARAEDLTDDVLDALIQATGMDPSKITHELVLGKTNVIPVDTSSADWGAANIANALNELGV